MPPIEAGSLRVLDILANASAVIAEGEVLQLATANDLGTGEAAYLQMIHGKTAALFAAATEVGGVIAAAPEAQVQALKTYGTALGMAFQIVDDVLDATQPSDTLGKTAGKDADANKPTYVSLLGLGGARQEADALLAQALSALSRSGLADTALQPLSDLAHRIVHRDH